MICACSMGHSEVIKVLLNDSRIDINCTNSYEESALSTCCSKIDKNIKIIEDIELLLNHPQIDPNIPKIGIRVL